MNNSLKVLGSLMIFISGNFIGILVALGIFIAVAGVTVSQNFDQLSAVLLALPTLMVGLFGTWIACAQWIINQRRLQHELFDRRIKLYQVVAEYLANAQISAGGVVKGEEMKFAGDTKHAIFIFDQKIDDYVRKIYGQTIELHLIYERQKNLKGKLLDKSVEEEKEIFEWFSNELNNLPRTFEKFLKL